MQPLSPWAVLNPRAVADFQKLVSQTICRMRIDWQKGPNTPGAFNSFRVGPILHRLSSPRPPAEPLECRHGRQSPHVADGWHDVRSLGRYSCRFSVLGAALVRARWPSPTVWKTAIARLWPR